MDDVPVLKMALDNLINYLIYVIIDIMSLTDILLIIIILVLIVLLVSLPSFLRKALGERVEMAPSGPRKYTKDYTGARIAPSELLVEIYSPLPGGEGNVDFSEVKRGVVRIKVNDIDEILKKITGLNLKNVKVIVIEPEEGPEKKEG